MPAAARGAGRAGGRRLAQDLHRVRRSSSSSTRQIREAHKPPPPEFAGHAGRRTEEGGRGAEAAAEESKKALAALPAEQRAQIEEAMKAAQATDRADEHA